MEGSRFKSAARQTPKVNAVKIPNSTWEFISEMINILNPRVKAKVVYSIGLPIWISVFSEAAFSFFSQSNPTKLLKTTINSLLKILAILTIFCSLCF